MILRKYLDTTGTSQKDFAESIGVTEGRVSQLASGAHTPSFGLAVMIDRVTGGAVKMQDWTKGESYGEAVLERREARGGTT